LGSSTIGAMIDGRGVRLAERVKTATTDWLSGATDRALAFSLSIGADSTASLSNALTLASFEWFRCCVGGIALVDPVRIQLTVGRERRATDLRNEKVRCS